LLLFRIPIFPFPSDQESLFPQPIYSPETLGFHVEQILNEYDIQISHSFYKQKVPYIFIARRYGLDIDIDGVIHSIPGDKIENVLNTPGTLINAHWEAIKTNAHDIFDISLPSKPKPLATSIFHRAQSLIEQ
jgi:hypothetical protein